MDKWKHMKELKDDVNDRDDGVSFKVKGELKPK